MSVELEARVRRANLISRDRHLERLYDDDLSRRLLRDIYSKKEGRMTETTDRPEPTTVKDVPPDEEAFRPPTRRQRRSPAFVPAILTAVIAIGIIVALVARQPAFEVADTPVGIAEQFMAALNEHDADSILALMADDGVFGDREDNDRGEIRQEEVLGWTYHVEECVDRDPESSGGVSHVGCTFAFSNDITRATGTGPYPGNSYHLWVEDGRITVAQSSDPSTDLFEDQALVLFWEWMLENHPGEFENMFWDYTDEENLAKWEQFLPEFVAAIEETG